jgi:hypothetical protein
MYFYLNYIALKPLNFSVCNNRVCSQGNVKNASRDLYSVVVLYQPKKDYESQH